MFPPLLNRRHPAAAARATLHRHGLLTAAALGLACAAVAAHAAGTAAAASPTGRYITASGNLEVDVAPCGPALCGTVTRVLANRSMHRPGQALQPADGRPALGLQLLSGFRPVARWTSEAEPSTDTAGPVQWQGRIHDRESGRTYDALLWQDAAQDLVVRGYVGLPVFGRTQVWHRVSAAAAPVPAPASAPAPAAAAASSPAAAADRQATWVERP